MPHVIACAKTSCMHHVACTWRQAGHPYDYVACQKLLIDLLFVPANNIYQNQPPHILTEVWHIAHF